MFDCPERINKCFPLSSAVSGRDRVRAASMTPILSSPVFAFIEV
jgi:hypothetical protein